MPARAQAGQQPMPGCFEKLWPSQSPPQLLRSQTACARSANLRASFKTLVYSGIPDNTGTLDWQDKQADKAVVNLPILQKCGDQERGIMSD